MGNSWEEARSWDELVERCTPLATDVTLPSVAAWKAANLQRKVVGCFPVYTPQELIAAAGALPVSLFGGRGQVEIDHADSRIQSFVCSIARSTLELGLAGQWKHVDGMVVPSICDVARNLLGVWQRNFPDRFTFSLHWPQNVSAVGVAYYRGELERLRQRLAELTGALASDKQLHDAIQLFNRNRALLGELYQRRARRAEQWPTADLYVFAGAGNVLPREDHNRLLEKALALGETRPRPKRDSVRVVVRGAFCEQPPLELLRVLEEAGCAVVAEAYLQRTVLTPVNTPGQRSRNDGLLATVEATAAHGVIFASPKFCEPALYDSVLLKQALEKRGTPFTEFEYEEKMTVFESIRMQTETFVESILFFSEK